MDKTDNNAVTNQPENNNPFSNTIASCDGGQTLRVAACWDRRIGNICIWPCLWRWSKYGGNDWRYIGGRCIICGEEGIEITAVVEKQWPKVLMMVAVMVWRALRRLSHSTAIGWWAHLERIWDERDLLSAMGGNTSKMAHTKKNLLFPHTQYLTSPYFWEYRTEEGALIAPPLHEILWPHCCKFCNWLNI